MIRRKKIFLALLIVCMVLIFAFSSRPGDESAEDSSWVSMLVGELFVPGFDEWSQAEQEAFAAGIDHPVRKTAHATEYAVLALLAAGAFIDRTTGIRAGIVVPCLIAAGYAATDEFHQLFVEGRSGQFSDVMIDTAGALAGMLMLASVRIMIRKRRENRRQTVQETAGDGSGKP